MAGYFQKVIVAGVAQDDPDAQYTAGGKLLVKFAVRYTSSFTNQSGERQFENVYFNMVAWDRQAELATQMIKKGSQVLVECAYEPNSYVSKDDGKKKTFPQFRVKEFRMLGDKQADGGEKETEEVGQPESAQDSLPF